MNLIYNATGLDGPARYSSDGGVVSTDEAVLGAPGRVVLVGSGATLYTWVPLGAEGPGRVATIFAHHGPDARLMTSFWRAVDVIVADPVQLPKRRVVDVAPARGIPSTFSFSRGQLPVPTNAERALVFTVDGTSRLLLKPYLSLTDHECFGWRPGPHDNPDLDLPAWPHLPLPQVGGFSVSPTGMRSGFDSDSRVPITMEVNRSPWHVLRATVSLDALQRDRLQQFYESAVQPFWYVRPDTMQVCRAWWLDDGDPEDNGLARGRTTSYGLLLEPA